jgi:UDP-3-O-[3-hydroxymyristoyl] glucosamine N-acyltransferase
VARLLVFRVRDSCRDGGIAQVFRSETVKIRPMGRTSPDRIGASERHDRRECDARALLRHRRRQRHRRRLLDRQSHVFVGSACEIGSDCEIHPHSSIGSDGFGYAIDARGRPRKICQLGNVVIGDDVEIGSNCAIDRATLTSTRIRSGAKLDNICHIAHNCDLGEDGLYTAGFMMAGSTTIGRRFMTGGNSVVSAHLNIADDVSLQGRSNVTKSISRSGAYGGYPLQPLQDALRTTVNLGHLSKLRRDLKRVMNHLKLSSDEADA